MSDELKEFVASVSTDANANAVELLKQIMSKKVSEYTDKVINDADIDLP